MSRSFDITLESPASVEQIHSAFGDQTYWLARLAALDDCTTLDSLSVRPDGTVSVATSKDLRHNALPGLLAKLYRGDLEVLTRETWTPIGDRQVRGRIEVAASGAPGSGCGTALLTPKKHGSQMALTATVRFDVPLIGGRIESFLAGQLADGLAAIQRFTTGWVTAHVSDGRRTGAPYE
jgi:Protein of unknown function (DUF2505)